MCGRGGGPDSSKYLTHSICINPLIGLLPAASPVNNCWAGMRGTSGGRTLYACHPVEKNVLVTLCGEQRAQNSAAGGGGKVTFRTELLFFFF